MTGKGSLVGLLMILLAACACQRKEAELRVIASHDLDAARIVLKSSTGDFKQGSNDLVVEFLDAKGSLLPVEQARMAVLMLSPGMAPITNATVLLPTGTKGRFAGRLNFKVTGQWLLSVEYVSRDGPDGASFTVDVK